MDDESLAEEAVRRKIAFMEQRKRTLGPEYYQSKDFWDRMWEQEWYNLEERKTLEIEEIIEVIPINHPIVSFEDKEYKIYTYSDFKMLHNQGIFRDDEFILDHTGKWKKNVISEMESYGYALIKSYKKNMVVLSNETVWKISKTRIPQW